MVWLRCDGTFPPEHHDRCWEAGPRAQPSFKWSASKKKIFILKKLKKHHCQAPSQTNKIRLSEAELKGVQSSSSSWNTQAENLNLKMHARSVMSDSLRPHGTEAHQAPLSMRFPRQEDWSGFPFPFPGDLPDQGLKLESPVSPTGGFFPRWYLGNPCSKPAQEWAHPVRTERLSCVHNFTLLPWTDPPSAPPHYLLGWALGPASQHLSWCSGWNVPSHLSQTRGVGPGSLG